MNEEEICKKLELILKQHTREIDNIDIHKDVEIKGLINELLIDSLDLVVIIMEIEDEFDIGIPDGKLFSFVTVKDLVEFIQDMEDYREEIRVMKKRLEEYENDIEDISEEKMEENYQIKGVDWYELDPDKIKTLEDIVKVICGLQITISEQSELYDELKKYLKDEPVSEENK